MEVSWQVMGIRKDAYANAHRIPVEEAKPTSDRGHYLHPDAWGKPATLGIAANRVAAEQPEVVQPKPQ